MSIRRDYVAEIESKRARARSHTIPGALRVHELSAAYERARHDRELRRYFPVALIAVIEGSVREAVSRLIEQAAGTLDSFLRSQWAREQKFDLTILRAVAGRRISLGELVSHLLPLKSVEQIDVVMSAVLGRTFTTLLEAVHDRWSVEIGGKAKAPIISDLSSVLAALASAFRQRHILAHEPAGETPSEDEVTDQLHAVAAFVDATDEIVSQTIDPNAPLTQADMNIRAAGEAQKVETRLSAALTEAKAVLHDKRQELLDRSQVEWLKYCETQAENEGLAFEGGSLRPTIQADARTLLLQARLADIRRLLVDWEGPPEG